MVNPRKQAFWCTVLTVESATTRPGIRSRKLCCKTSFQGTLEVLPCLLSAQDPNLLCGSSVSHAVHTDLLWVPSTNHGGDGEGRRNHWWGLLQDNSSGEGERSAEHKKTIAVQQRSETTFSIRALHIKMPPRWCMEIYMTLQLNFIIAQHEQEWDEIRWARPSHDSWLRLYKASRHAPKCDSALPRKLHDGVNASYIQFPEFCSKLCRRLTQTPNDKKYHVIEKTLAGRKTMFWPLILFPIDAFCPQKSWTKPPEHPSQAQSLVILQTCYTL